MIRAGISTACFYPETTERSLELTAAAGAVCTEIFVNADQEFSPRCFQAYGRFAKENGIDIVSIHPYTSGFETALFFSDYLRRLEDGLHLYSRFFELAASVGARYFVLHGAAIKAKLEDACIFERFGLLARQARSFGVTLLQENVARCKSRSPAYIRAMRAALGEEAAFVLDVKQAVRAGFSVGEMQEAMGEGIRHVHISDCDSERDCLPPGVGAADLPGFIASLRAGGYTGDLILELYKDSYTGLVQLYESYVYLTRLLSI